MKPYYKADGVEIYCGDFRALARSLPKADLVIADPPYTETTFAWDQWPNHWPESAWEALKETGSMWCFGSLKMFFKFQNEFVQWTHAQEIVWEKHNGSNMAKDRIRRVHELALHFYWGKWANVYKSPVYTQDAKRRRVHRQAKPSHWNGIQAGNYESDVEGNRLLRSVIYARSCHGHAVNPTQKPVEILCPLIEHSCPPKGLVLEPFMGSGSALVAARMLGRRAIGVDIRESECRAAKLRLESM